MICDQCGAHMMMVGRMTKPGHPEIWMDGYVCPKRRCPGYGTSDHKDSTSRWPGMTLVDVPLHREMRSALKARDEA